MKLKMFGKKISVDERAGATDAGGIETFGGRISILGETQVDVGGIIMPEIKDYRHLDAEMEEGESKSAPPQHFYIGFSSGLKRRMLMEHLIGLSTNYMHSPYSTHYSIVKFGEGWLFELQDGGQGKGCLKSIIPLLEQGEDVRIPTASAQYLVSWRNGALESYHIETPAEPASAELRWEDSMARLVKKGSGWLIFGTSMLILGLVTWIAAAIFKYGVVNEHKKPIFLSSGKPTVLSQMPVLSAYEMEGAKQIAKIEFKDGAWSIDEVTDPATLVAAIESSGLTPDPITGAPATVLATTGTAQAAVQGQAQIATITGATKPGMASPVMTSAGQQLQQMREERQRRWREQAAAQTAAKPGAVPAKTTSNQKVTP